LRLGPFLRRLARLPPWEPRVIDLPLARRIAPAADRHQFFTVRVANGRVEPAFTGSSHITSMAEADGYIEIPAGTPSIEAGTLVRVTLFN
jgi:molybdopterin biosynthesis enzyme